MKSNLWKLILCSLLLLGSACTLLACSPTGKDDPTPPVDEEVPPQRLYDTVLEEVILSSGEDRLAINFCREDVVHFRYAPAGTDFAPEGAVPESITKYDRDYAPVYGEIEQTDDATILRTEGFVI